MTTETWPPDVAARGLPITVVACKLPGDWIIRAIGPFQKPEKLVEWIRPYVMLHDQERLEWSQHTYHVPHYLVYGDGDMTRWGWPETGVFLFRHHGDPDGGVYRDAQRLRGSDG